LKVFKPVMQVLFVIVLLLSEASVFFTPYKVDAAPIVEGNTVRISLNDAYIEATPATLTSSGWVDVTFWTRYYEGPVDVVYGFNGLDNVKAVNPQVWESYVHNKTRQVPAVLTGTFKPDKVISTNTAALRPLKADTDLSLNSKYTEITYEQTDPIIAKAERQTIKLAYDTYDSKTGTYSYKYNGQVAENYTETYVDWNPKSQPVTNTLSHAGANKWDVAQYKSVAKNEVQKARVWIDIPFNGTNVVSGKYNIGIKPSNLTLQQAKDQSKLWLLDPWYNASWLYRKAIVIGQTDDLGPGIYYQVKLLIGKSNGADLEDFDCENHCEEDFDDLRFTKDDGTTLLDYWIESSGASGTSYLATVWVEAEMEDAAADTTIYVYYGNVGAPAASSGANTFIKFDDIGRGNDGDAVGGSWTNVNNVEIDTAIYWPGAGSSRSGRWAGTVSDARVAQLSSSTIAIQFRMQKTDAAGPVVWHGDGVTTMYPVFRATEGWEYYDGVGYTNVETLSHSTWYLFEYRNFDYDANTFDMVRDGVVKKVGADMAASALGANSIRPYQLSGSGDFYIDNLIVRKWTANEPVFSSAGVEEGFPTCALTGTITTATDADIITGGETIILTLTGDTWVAAGATFNAIRDDIIAGMDSAQSEANGWDAEYKANAAAYVADVVRTNDTVVTVTMSALATYSVTASETITVTVPAAALTLGADVVASPTFTITKVLPLVSTQATSVITTTSALGNGTITDLNGGGNATVRGFEYDVDTGAPYAHEVHDNGSYGVGAYTKTMSGLTSGELYYNRAYATSPLGTGYGTEVTFLTLPSDPASITATVVSDSEIDLTWPAVVCGAGTVVNYYVRANLGSAPTFSGAGGTTIYDSTLLAYNHTPLGSGEHWYYRMWVRITDGGLEQYSTNFAADDGTVFIAPTVTTGICSGSGTTWALLNGNVTATGIPTTVTQTGFEYGLTTAYGTLSPMNVGSFGAGAFFSNLTGLSPSTVYHYRAMATNGAWGYGSDAIFATKGSPAITTYFNTGSDSCMPIYGTTVAAQTFTTSATTQYSVTSVRLEMLRVLTPGTVTVSVRRASGGVPTGVDLTSGTINGDSLSTSPQWYDIQMTTETSLELNSSYAIVVSAASGDAANYVCWRYASAGGYAGGNGATSTDGGITWSTSPAEFAGLGASLSSAPYDDDAWVAPTNIYVDDSVYASVTAATFDTNDYTEVLNASTFGFAIPSSATITGIKVEVDRYCGAGAAKDGVIQLTKDGAARVGASAATATAWPATSTTVSYGGAADLWGTTWTPAEVNTATFGVHIAAQATGDDTDVYVDFVRITVYYSYDYMFEIWGNQSLEIQDAKVFQSYKDTGDWLVAVRYVNIYAPYYDTYDVKKYFTLQLVDSLGNVKASTVMPAWGNRVGSIYLSATTVASLTYGGSYRVRIQGTFTGTPYSEYALASTDWMGDDLVNLDSWVITSASVLGTYYSTTMTTYIAERGEVLNSTGSGIFSSGIAGLSTVRPAIFQTYTIPSAYTPGTITQAGRLGIPAWQTNIGTTGTVMLTRLGNIVGVGGDIIAVIAFLIMIFILAALAFPAGHTTAALGLSLPMLGAAIWFGMDLLYIGVLALIAAFLFIKNFWIDKGN
jgi:hypothetical protein